MSFLLIRTYALLTAVAYLAVGTMAVRSLSPKNSTIEISSEFFNIFSTTTYSITSFSIPAPVQKFENIPHLDEAPRKRLAITVAKKKSLHAPIEVHTAVLANELSFTEPVTVKPIFFDHEFAVNLASLYKVPVLEIAKVETSNPHLEDEIVTKQASSEEPEFFEYSKETASTPVQDSTVSSDASHQSESTTDDVDRSKSVDITVEEFAVNELLPSDYSKDQKAKAKLTVPKPEVVTIQDIAYQGATSRDENFKLHTMKKTPNSAPKVVVNSQGTQNSDADSNPGFVPKQNEETRSVWVASMAIHTLGTDLNNSSEAVGFEVRPQDDLAEAISDYNSGSVLMEEKLSQEKMIRTVAILKRGHAVTNTDLILEAGPSEVTIPLVSDETFNELLAPYESRGPMGIVLVELDQSTVDVALDVPYSKVIRLDEKLKVTSAETYAYQLFVGVKAGNVLLSYKDTEGTVTSKIIHVHEHELTFEMNFYERVENDQVVLLEEDLLGREKTPVIISEDNVKLFAKDKTSTKLNDHTYKTNVTKNLLGTRQYLELLHQSEPVYVGFRDVRTISLPSENFMRFVLSKFEGSRLGNRCLVQVNLTKEATKVDVAPESLGQSVQTHVQILDKDGKFYDSAGPKSEKIIVVGEGQGGEEHGKDAKINVKITYQDGSVQFLGSYCSPNTYLVEQL